MSPTRPWLRGLRPYQTPTRYTAQLPFAEFDAVNSGNPTSGAAALPPCEESAAQARHPSITVDERSRLSGIDGLESHQPDPALWHHICAAELSIDYRGP